MYRFRTSNVNTLRIGKVSIHKKYVNNVWYPFHVNVKPNLAAITLSIQYALDKVEVVEVTRHRAEINAYYLNIVSFKSWHDVHSI